ncbi:MAG: hypothetical protein JWM11_1972, partial [Planctomycetaceae bacterium]|nr:hypothetical protein [Planctomycetaceae bacterium]
MNLAECPISICECQNMLQTLYAVFFCISALGTEPVTVGDSQASAEMQNQPAPLACELESKIDPRNARWTHGGWQDHGVVRINGSDARQTLPSKLNFIGGEWPYNNSQIPYLVFMPEHNRLMLTASVDKPAIKSILVFSDDFGQTWTKPRWLHTNAEGKPDVAAATQLTYVGNGKLVFGTETRYWMSSDYGETWKDFAPVLLGTDGKPMHQWDPLLVDRDLKTGTISRLVETRYKGNGTFDKAGYFSQGCLRSSFDGGF